MSKFNKLKLFDKNVHKICDYQFLTKLKQPFSSILNAVRKYCCDPGVFIEDWRLYPQTCTAAITKIKTNANFYLLYFTRVNSKRVTVLYDISCKEYYLISDLYGLQREWFENTLLYGYYNNEIFNILDCFMLKNIDLLTSSELFIRLSHLHETICKSYKFVKDKDIFELRLVEYSVPKDELQILNKNKRTTFLFVPLMTQFGKVFINGFNAKRFIDEFMKPKLDEIQEDYDPSQPYAL